MRLGTHHTSRILFALALGTASLLLLCSSALGAWGGTTQVTGYSTTENVVASIDDDGTQQLGFFATGTLDTQGLYNLTRAPGVTAWTSKKVFGPINNGRFAFARNGAAVATWRGGGETVFAAYKPAGGAWGSPAQLDNPAKLGTAPIPVISAKGAAAVVWSSKSAPGVREPDQVMYSATSSASWPGGSLLASIAVAQPVNTEHFLACLPGSDLVAAMLPSGKPIAAWNDVYGSYKQTVTSPAGENELGVCGVKAATPESSPTVVTPRPAIGWNATPSGELPFWRPVSITVDPDSGRTALVVRGKASAVITNCSPQPVDYCFENAGFETHALLGEGAAIGLPGTLTASLAQVALRNGFVAAATGSSTAALAGEVGTGFPTGPALLSPDALLTNSAIAVGRKGEAELLIHDGAKLIAYSAPAGGQFGPAVDIKSGSAGRPSVAIGCNGDALVAWNQGASNLWAAFSPSGAARCEGSGGGGEEPGPGPGPGPTSTPASGGGQSTPPPTSPPLSPTKPKPPALKCKKGFQKKTVKGKAKCVKKPKKGKKRH